MNANDDNDEIGRVEELERFLLDEHVNQAIERHFSTQLTLSSATIVANTNDNTDDATKKHSSALNDDANNIHEDEEEGRMNQNHEVENLLNSDKLNLESLLQDLHQNPPPKLLERKNKNKKQATSFSLLDMLSSTGDAGMGMGFSSLRAPTYNIRDIIECEDSNPMKVLTQCMDSGVRVQDLILGFNTTQREVVALANLLHGTLTVVFPPNSHRSNTHLSSALSLHETWMVECVKDAPDCTSFAFLLLRNVILASCQTNETLTMRERVMMVKTVKKMLCEMMKVWTDVSSFQTPWMEIMYLFIRASFPPIFKLKDVNGNGRAGNDSKSSPCYNPLHVAWAYHDTTGEVFATCLACMDSALNVQLLMEKTYLVQYLMYILTKGLQIMINDTRHKGVNVQGMDIHTGDVQVHVLDFNLDLPSVIMTHALSLLRIIMENCPSFWTLIDGMGENWNNDVTSFAAKEDDRSMSSSSICELPTLENHSQLCHWIQCLDEEMKLLSMTKSEANIKYESMMYWMHPFLTLLEIDLLTLTGNEGVTINVSFRGMYEGAITRIIQTCAWSRDVNLVTAVMGDVFQIVQSVQEKQEGKTKGNCPDILITSISGLVSICGNIFPVIPWCDIEGPNVTTWGDGLSHIIHIILEMLDQIDIGQTMHQSRSHGQEDWGLNPLHDDLNQILGIFLPLLSNESAMVLLNTERIRLLILTYCTAMTRCSSSKVLTLSEMTPCLAMLSWSSYGIKVMSDVDELNVKSVNLDTDSDDESIISHRARHFLSISNAVSSIFNVLLRGREYVEIFNGKTLDAWSIVTNLCSYDDGCDAILCSDDFNRLCNFLKMYSKGQIEDGEDGARRYEIALVTKFIAILVSSDMFAAALCLHKSRGFAVVETLVVSLSETENESLVKKLLRILQSLFDNRTALTAIVKEESGRRFYKDFVHILQMYEHIHTDGFDMKGTVQNLRMSLPQAPQS